MDITETDIRPGETEAARDQRLDELRKKEIPFQDFKEAVQALSGNTATSIQISEDFATKSAEEIQAIIRKAREEAEFLAKKKREEEEALRRNSIDNFMPFLSGMAGFLISSFSNAHDNTNGQKSAEPALAETPVLGAKNKQLAPG